MELDEIIYNAIIADATLLEDTGGSVKSTCIEVPPTEDDNTELPYIIVAEEASQNDQGTKDSTWESRNDIVNVSVIISSFTPNEVRRLRRLVRKAVTSYVKALPDQCPRLQALSWDGIAWDWMKPCYYDTLHYQCDMENNLNEEDDEQE
ncbi:MAG: hypothetical protein K6E67_10425 [Prevotella sp.]|nr:hypothetical protein [Prevotella sp.]